MKDEDESDSGSLSKDKSKGSFRGFLQTQIKYGILNEISYKEKNVSEIANFIMFFPLLIQLQFDLRSLSLIKK